MEVLVVDYGCDYERYVVGVAHDIIQARTLARSYMKMCDEKNFHAWEYFAVKRQVLGEASDNILDWDRLDLD